MSFTIGICAPSSQVDPAKIEAGKNWLETKGARVVVHPQTFATSQGSEAGPAAQRAAAVTDLMHDSSINAVMAARGGNRCLEILPLLNFNSLPHKPFMGFSDATSLLCGLYQGGNTQSWHGPALHSFASPTLTEAHKTQALNALQHGLTAPLNLEGECVIEGEAEGVLLGGNLSLLTALAGTAYMPDLKGSILFLEDWHEETSKLDRMLETLKLQGVFQTIAALVLGNMDPLPETGTIPFGYSVVECVQQKLEGRRIPLITHAAFGHGNDLLPLPFGKKMRLSKNCLTSAL